MGPRRRQGRSINLQIQITTIVSVVYYILIGPLKIVQAGLIRREAALEESPSDGYAPVWVNCPTNFTVRQPTVRTKFVCDQESNYVAIKSAKSIPSWRSYLSRVQLSDFDIDSFIPNEIIPGKTLPNIGLAISGGGIRALLGCAGVLNAFDDRNDQANQYKTGGVLQLANYITGLSGGSWLVGSWATSDFPTFTELNQTVWNLTEKNSYTSWNSIKRYPKAIKQAIRKSKAGFPASLVDVQAYILSHHLINDTHHHGSQVLFSSIRNTTGYKNHTAPFPILLATSRHRGTSIIDLDTPIYEFSTEEFGVAHPTLNAFIPIDFLGTRLINGLPQNFKSCVNGFDNAGFVIGASSNVLSQPGVSGSLTQSWQAIETQVYKSLTRNVYDEAIIPNPFYQLGMRNGTREGYVDRDEENLYLADGGWGGEIVPFWPLLQPDRKLDVIVAIDYVADGPSMYHGSYPNGTSLWMTYMKTKMPGYEDIKFPVIPDPAGPFSQQGLNKRPSFFGCYENSAPLVVYLPNYFVLANTKMATMKTDYTVGEINGFFSNSFAIATQTSSQVHYNGFDPDDALEPFFDRAGPISHTQWSSCLACALVDRQLIRNHKTRSPQCRACFDKYCA